MLAMQLAQAPSYSPNVMLDGQLVHAPVHSPTLMLAVQLVQVQLYSPTSVLATQLAQAPLYSPTLMLARRQALANANIFRFREALTTTWGIDVTECATMIITVATTAIAMVTILVATSLATAPRMPREAADMTRAGNEPH